MDEFDNWFDNLLERPVARDDELAASRLSSPVNDASFFPNWEDDETIAKKRKHGQDSTFTESKRAKPSSLNMRRNIQELLTEDQLHVATLAAWRVEEDRLQRLQDMIEHRQCYLPFDTPPSIDDDDPVELLSIKHESFVPVTMAMDRTEHTNQTTTTPCDQDTDSDDDDDDDDDEPLLRQWQRLHVDDRINRPDEHGHILINVNHPREDPDLYAAKHLSPILKPHQIGGIRFMYDNIVQSRYNFETTIGLGCILAHSMGCGKTLQIITFIDIFLRHTPARTVLIVVPVNTIQNWANEFDRWCPVEDTSLDYQRPYQLYLANESLKKGNQQVKLVQDWCTTGGTLIMGYELFLRMVGNKSRPRYSIAQVSTETADGGEALSTTEEVKNALCNADLVICDEGHRIKNYKARSSSALKSVRTTRRIVLTGYPLQNNLLEYWCMVDFVRPNYLGSKKEFCNLFERPIANGQCIDSTPQDRQIMRARAHVLHSQLEGFIQRRGPEILRPDLPSKTESVILLQLSKIQRELYLEFLNAVRALPSSSEKGMNPLCAFAICSKIWNHPDHLYRFLRENKEDDEVDMDPSSPEKKEFNSDFANELLDSYVCGQVSNGIKFEVAFSILDQSIEHGDKVLLFSQSLLSLNKFEEFLGQRSLPNTDETWKKNSNYYRLDGSTASLERDKLINAFNASDSLAKLFLLSTRAGCLGINLVAANRVIIMDVSWNPCHDAQAICRVYRYGQTKPCYIYRLIADFTMEKRIYDRQVTKQGISNRVVDELPSSTQFTRSEVANLFYFADEEKPRTTDLLRKLDDLSDDPILRSTCQRHVQSITRLPFTHESLLSDSAEYQLTSVEKRRAQKQYQHERQGKRFPETATLPSTSRCFTEAQHHPYCSPSMETPILSGHVLSALAREPDFIRTADGNIFGARDSIPWQLTDRATVPETIQSFSPGKHNVWETLVGP